MTTYIVRTFVIRIFSEKRKRHTVLNRWVLASLYLHLDPSWIRPVFRMHLRRLKQYLQSQSATRGHDLARQRILHRPFDAHPAALLPRAIPVKVDRVYALEVFVFCFVGRRLECNTVFGDGRDCAGLDERGIGSRLRCGLWSAGFDDLPLVKVLDVVF